MGTKNLVMLKTRIDSINISSMNDFVYGNMLWALACLRVFFCNFVLYLFGLILRYIFRFQVGDTKNELHVPPPPQFPDYGIDGFREELANFLFRSSDHEGGDEREGETESYAFMETVSDVPEDSENIDGEIVSSVLMDSYSDIPEGAERREGQTDSTDNRENDKKRGTEAEGSVFMESESAKSAIHEDGMEQGGEKEGFVFMETGSDVHEDGKKIEENETESSVFVEDASNVHQDSKRIEEEEKKKERKEEDEEEETEDHVFMETDSTTTTTSKCQYVSGKDISGFIEEPTTMSFTFRQFYMGPDVSAVSDNAFAKTGVTADKEFSELNSENNLVTQEEEEEEEEESVQELRTLSMPSTYHIPFRFQSEEAFGGSDSSDEDYFHFNENSLASDSESESSSSSGLIWGNSNKIDDSITYQFLASNDACEGFESENLKVMKEEEAEDVEATKFSCGGKVSGFGVHSSLAQDEYIELEPRMKDAHGFSGIDFAKAEKEGSDIREEAYRDSLKKADENRWEDELAQSDSEEQDEDGFEWEHDDLVQQLRLELRNARQGGLPTILEEEEDDDEKQEEEEKEAEPAKMVEDLKPLKIEEKLELEEQIDEIEKVYKSYAEKMRKLDNLNYQTLHTIGLLQLKDPLKIISTPKTTIQGGKPLISQNLWPRKAPKNKSDPLLKFVHELHRDLELVYVGQVCLSWEILCWQHKKAQELKQYDSQGSRRYNLVAGEFQLFQVLLQRFIENEPFQGPRIQNYVKNRCVIRNLLQVPAIKDDGMKDKNIIKEGEEDAIGSGRLADIIKESMRVFWEFARADKDDGNVILKAFHQMETDLKDPAISDLLVDIRNHQQKKEKKLKDIVRSGNCIVKKFQKHREDQLDHEQLLAQVGLRLISRVVNMSKLRKEQLIWCNEKLNRIKFLSRKIVQLEPSFSLFPC